ncbi:MAG: PilZ domain-containing protein [Candidatus Omnitrophota bacterium]
MRDKRNFTRFVIAGVVVIKTEEGVLETFRAYLDNVSFGGFLIYSQRSIDVDKIVKFELVIKPLAYSLSGKGKVKYVVKTTKYKSPFFRIGIEFVDINKDIVAYEIKRIQREIFKEKRRIEKVETPDFMPY